MSIKAKKFFLALSIIAVPIYFSPWILMYFSIITTFHTLVGVFWLIAVPILLTLFSVSILLIVEICAKLYHKQSIDKYAFILLAAITAVFIVIMVGLAFGFIVTV